MVRSMVAGVAGLRTHQSKLDVIGNNIANVNTWGFRSSSFNFQDSMYSTTINSSAGSNLAGSAGGRNASQVGYGVTTGSISSVFETGAPAPSARSLDCMIDGTGFFLVGNMVNGSFTNVADSGLYLSRVGIFSVDGNGYLVDDQRNYVYGYALNDGTGIPEKPATKSEWNAKGAAITITDGTPKTISIGGIDVPTTSTKFEDQIQDWITAVTSSTSDPRGELADFNISLLNFNENPADGVPTVDLQIIAKQAGKSNELTGGPEDDRRTLDTIINEIFTEDQFSEGNKLEATVFGNYRIPGVAAEYSEELSTIKIPIDPDTGKPYNIQSYKINEDGTIMGTDKLNRSIAIGQVALITVENPNGLEKDTGYYYSIGANAGRTEAIKANGGPAGTILGNYLEMANVDLANEFSQMITTQRGYQANSKIITVTDQMLEELVNLKR